MRYTIRRVTTPQDMDAFVSLPHKIYKGCPYYVPDLDSDVRGWFEKEHNPGLEHTDVAPFVAYDAEGNPVGRIAGILNHKANTTWNVRCVRFGWIEFIDDVDVAKALLDAVAEWGKSLGMDTIQGPLGISDFDKEGMLVEDFDQPGSVISIYNHAYYPTHLEKLGFQKKVDWVQVKVDIPKEIPARFARVKDIVDKKFHFQTIKVTKKQIVEEGYGQKLFDLLNKAYSPLFGFTKHTPQETDAFVSQYLPLLNMDMLPIIVDSDGHLVGCAITMPSLTKAMQKAHGRLLPFGWFHLLKALKFKHEDKVEMMLIAVDPEWQAHGVNALIFADLIPTYLKMGFTWAETGPMLENNTKVLSQWEQLNPTIYKRRRCYTKDL